MASAQAKRRIEQRFLREADPAGVLPPAERERRARHLKQAHFADLALRSAKARRARREVA